MNHAFINAQRFPLSTDKDDVFKMRSDDKLLMQLTIIFKSFLEDTYGCDVFDVKDNIIITDKGYYVVGYTGEKQKSNIHHIQANINSMYQDIGKMQAMIDKMRSDLQWMQWVTVGLVILALIFAALLSNG